MVVAALEVVVVATLGVVVVATLGVVFFFCCGFFFFGLVCIFADWLFPIRVLFQMGGVGCLIQGPQAGA